MKFIFSLIFSVFCLFSNLLADDFRFSSEYLEYDVYWKFLNLGKIRVWTRVEGDSVYSKIHVESNPYIFFVNVNYTFESKFHKENPLNSYLNVYEVKDAVPLKTIFLRQGNDIVAKQFDMKSGVFIGQKSIYYPDIYYHGITAFFVARKLCGTGVAVYIPLLFATEEKLERPPFIVRIEKVKFNFPEKRENVKISSLNSEVQTIELNGYASFVSKELAGISGEFNGWFSDDWARVPIKATFNTFLGVVRLELSKWEKDSWSPPLKTN